MSIDKSSGMLEFSVVKIEPDGSENSKESTKIKEENLSSDEEHDMHKIFLIKQQDEMEMIKNEPDDPLNASIDENIPKEFDADEKFWRDSHTKSRYDCRFCPVHYQSKRQLFGHVRQVHSGELENSIFFVFAIKNFLFSGETTTKETIYEKNLVIIDRTSSTIDYKCKECDNHKTVDYYSFKRHVYFEHELNKNCRICEHCDSIFSNKFALGRHIVNKHSSNKLALLYSMKKNNVLGFLVVGVKPKKLTCEQCAEECGDRRTLERHQQKKHGGK
jgi:hypothetical protein